ncbi:MAG: DUF2062 domain-containing protein [Sphingorhabdus sp.]
MVEQQKPQKSAHNKKQGWVDRNMPTREGMAKNRYLKPFAHRFLRSELWRFTRRSVPRGVALGIFAGFIIPVGQIILAAFLALPARANVPIAALTTFITNPFTFPFWIWVANKVGGFVLRIEELTGEPIGNDAGSGRWQWFEWFAKEAGLTAIGFLIMAVVFSSLGYVISSWLWAGWIKRKRQRRSKAFASRR